MWIDYKTSNKIERKNKRLEKGLTKFVDHARIKALTNSIKQFHGCFVCGYDDHPQALEFHHLNPTKKSFAIAAWATHTDDEEVIFKELGKCVVLCANCHRVIHTYMGKNGY